MDKIIKEIFEMVIELRKISQINNELLGFLCQKVAPATDLEKDLLDSRDIIITSLEMSELFEQYDVMPEEYGIA